MTTMDALGLDGHGHRAVPPHTRTEITGLALLGGAVLLVVLAGLVSGMPVSDAAFLLPMIAAPAIGAVLAWRYSTWGRAVGLVLGLAAAVMTFWLAFGILVPASAVEFTAATAFLLGTGLLLYGGVGALVRRSTLESAPAASEVLLDRVALGIVGLAVVVSVPLWFLGRTTIDESAVAGLAEVTASNFAFEDVTAPAGGELVVRNADPFAHTFTIDALGIDVDLLPGDATTVALPDRAGSYTYYCVPHSSAGGEGEDDMAATITLE